MVLPLRILALYAPVRAIYPPTSQILMVTGDSRFAMHMNGMSAVILPTAFLVGSHWGTAGIALAWCIAHPIVFVATVGRVLSRLEMTVADYFHAVKPAVLGCLAMAAAVLAIGYLFRTAPGGIRVTAEIAIGAIVYPGYLFLAQRDRLKALAAMWRERPA
jgi:Na+-driven multidrug efflux pump